MKNYFWILFTLLIITSCQFKEQKKEEKTYPFKDLEISAIIVDTENNLKIKDSTAIEEISSFLKKLSSDDLIKGKRLHGAKKLCDITIKKGTGDKILISIGSHKEDGITAGFLQENQVDNFFYSLGRLYNADNFVHLLEKYGLICGGQIK